ncbi:MAG: hypothetical protein ACXWXR_08135 [Candidatus Limnocylindrales bacterium]
MALLTNRDPQAVGDALARWIAQSTGAHNVRVLNAQAAPNVTAPAEPTAPVAAAPETFSQAEVDQRIAAAVAAAKAEAAQRVTPSAADPTSTAN